MRNALFTLRIWLYWILSIGSLVVGVYCVYRAVWPLIELYSGAINDPLGEWSEKTTGVQVRDEVWKWAIPGAIGIGLAGVLSFLASISWRRKMAQKVIEKMTGPVVPPLRPPQTKR
jgi:hypothetical protein